MRDFRQNYLLTSEHVTRTSLLLRLVCDLVLVKLLVLLLWLLVVDRLGAGWSESA